MGGLKASEDYSEFNFYYKSSQGSDCSATKDCAACGDALCGTGKDDAGVTAPTPTRVVPNPLGRTVTTTPTATKSAAKTRKLRLPDKGDPVVTTRGGRATCLDLA